MTLKIILGLVVLLFGFGVFQAYSEKQEPQTNPSTSASTSSSQGSRILFDLQIPGNDSEWIKYAPRCILLRGIEVSYPETWSPKEFGDDENCEVIFGYAQTPISPQAPGNEIAIFRVASYKDSKSLDQIISQHYAVERVGDLTLNGQDYKKENIKGSDVDILLTKKGDQVFRIQTIGKTGSLYLPIDYTPESSKSSSIIHELDFGSSAEVLNQEFLRRLKVL